MIYYQDLVSLKKIWELSDKPNKETKEIMWELWIVTLQNKLVKLKKYKLFNQNKINLKKNQSNNRKNSMVWICRFYQSRLIIHQIRSPTVNKLSFNKKSKWAKRLFKENLMWLNFNKIYNNKKILYQAYNLISTLAHLFTQFLNHNCK